MLAARATAILDADGPAESWPRALFIENETHFSLALGAVEHVVVEHGAAPRAVLEGAFELAARRERVVCGVRFDARGRAPSDWDAYGDAWCFAPRACITRQGDALSGVEGVLDLLARAPQQDVPATRTETAVDERFEVAGARALRAIDAGELEKVVLARRARHRVRVSPGTLARALGWRDGGMTYALAPRRGEAYVGRTPERLLHGGLGVFRTEAVAGTAPRFDDSTKDEASQRALLASDKDAREHAFVVEHIVAAAESAGGRVAVGARAIRTHGAVHHLVTPIEIALEPARVASLVARLHPTPALAGTPVDDAMRFIRDQEGFDRGLYGGLVGTISRSAIDLRVAIRGALLDDAHATIFVGAGFVAGSEVAREHQETEVKARALVEALAQDGLHA